MIENDEVYLSLKRIPDILDYEPQQSEANTQSYEGFTLGGQFVSVERSAFFLSLQLQNIEISRYPSFVGL